MKAAKPSTRREFLAQAAALGLAQLAGCAGVPDARAAGSSGALPDRGEFVVRGGYVMTMDPALGDIPEGAVHVRGGEIVAVGPSVNAPGVRIIDAAGMIVLPGLVETHWHMWNTLLRSMSADRKEHGYFPTALALGKAYQAEDMYRGTALGAAEAIHSGVTTVHDWCHNIQNPSFAEADLRALKDCGIRARFSYGQAQGQPGDKPIDIAQLEQLHRDWKRYDNGGLLSLGLAWRGTATGATGAVSAAAYRVDYDAAKRLGIPISVHSNNSRARMGTILHMATERFLGRDVQVIHATWVSPEEIRALAQSGASVSLSPYTEMRIGFGFPPTGEFLAAKIPVGLSVDTTALSGNADMFAIMKAIQNVENGRAENEFKLPARRVLELATLEGARSLGMDERIGSLKPGKRADFILVNTRELNMGVFSEPAHMLVEAAQPSNVDTVVVDGRILKREGKLTAIEVPELLRVAASSLAALRKRAGWW